MPLAQVLETVRLNEAMITAMVIAIAYIASIMVGWL